MKYLSGQACENTRPSVMGRDFNFFAPQLSSKYLASLYRPEDRAAGEKRVLRELKEWFLNYCRTFTLENGKHQQSIRMKKQHTLDVCRWIVKIGKRRGLSRRELLIAETSALLHDTGRFEQCRSYGTFWDKHSFNHAEVGAAIIREHGLLRAFTSEEQRIILNSVLYHNVFRVPDTIRGRDLFFLKLLRDADKLDILAIFSRYYHQSKEERCHIVGLDLSENGGFSPAILDDLRNRRNCNRDLVRTTVDHILLKFSFLFDINFVEALEILREEGFMTRLHEALPSDLALQDAISGLRAYFLDTKGIELFPLPATSNRASLGG